jgi:hypothetical protein
MALTAFCATCERTVYIDEDETPVCPVCSSPLLEAIEGQEGADEEVPAPQAEGSK